MRVLPHPSHNTLLPLSFEREEAREIIGGKIMQIAVVGAGNVGRAVGERWRTNGHDIVYGVRDPAKTKDLPNCARVSDAVADAEVIVLAVMFHAVEAALRDCQDSLSGRILIDPT